MVTIATSDAGAHGKKTRVLSGSCEHRRKTAGEIRSGTVTMSEKEFALLSEFIQSSCGIQLPPIKKTMLEGRLRKRLQALGIESFGKYCQYLFRYDDAALEAEYIHLIDAVTTNKTDFFREPDHFDYLTLSVLPELVESGLGMQDKLNVWSAGCSTGEEPYTLAMVLSEFAERHPGFAFSILATDISTEVLKKARSGIYDHQKVAPIPMVLRRKYLLRSKDKARGQVRIAPAIRANVRFARLNFMEERYALQEPIGIVFCRNVIIYFDRTTQEQILRRILHHVRPAGYLFMGHAESLLGMNLPLVQTAPTVYRKI
jgi:chemotaxis protein methyltransferase CheR